MACVHAYAHDNFVNVHAQALRTELFILYTLYFMPGSPDGAVYTLYFILYAQALRTELAEWSCVGLAAFGSIWGESATRYLLLTTYYLLPQ